MYLFLVEEIFHVSAGWGERVNSEQTRRERENLFPDLAEDSSAFPSVFCLPSAKSLW